MKLASLLHGRFLFVQSPNNGLSHHHSIMEGEESLRQYSPEVKVQDPNNRTAVSLLPPIILFHGTADYSIPSDSRFESYLIIAISHKSRSNQVILL